MFEKSKYGILLEQFISMRQAVELLEQIKEIEEENRKLLEEKKKTMDLKKIEASIYELLFYEDQIKKLTKEIEEFREKSRDINKEIIENIKHYISENLDPGMRDYLQMSGGLLAHEILETIRKSKDAKVK